MNRHIACSGFLVLFIAAAPGCFSQPERGQLADLSVPELDAFNVVNGDARALVVEIRDDGDCALLASDVTAAVNGVPMTIESLGAIHDDRCQTARVLIQGLDALLDAPTLTVEVQDSTMSMAMDFTNNLRPRVVTMPSHPEQELRRGDQVRLRWEPATDLLDGEPQISLGLSTGSSHVLGRNVELTDHDIVFTVPRDAPLGRVNLDISPDGWASSQIHRCDGAGLCSAANKDRPRLQVVVRN